MEAVHRWNWGTHNFSNLTGHHNRWTKCNPLRSCRKCLDSVATGTGARDKIGTWTVGQAMLLTTKGMASVRKCNSQTSNFPNSTAAAKQVYALEGRGTPEIYDLRCLNNCWLLWEQAFHQFFRYWTNKRTNVNYFQSWQALPTNYCNTIWNLYHSLLSHYRSPSNSSKSEQEHTLPNTNGPVARIFGRLVTRRLFWKNVLVCMISNEIAATRRTCGFKLWLKSRHANGEPYGAGNRSFGKLKTANMADFFRGDLTLAMVCHQLWSSGLQMTSWFRRFFPT